MISFMLFDRSALINIASFYTYNIFLYFSVQAPCALLCQPIGERFYMTFAESVPNGFPCILKDGSEDWNELSAQQNVPDHGVCLNGTCQVSTHTGRNRAAVSAANLLIHLLLDLWISAIKQRNRADTFINLAAESNARNGIMLTNLFEVIHSV